MWLVLYSYSVGEGVGNGVPPIRARTGLRLPFSGGRPCQFREKACQLPCLIRQFSAVFTSEMDRVSYRANMGEFERAISGEDGFGMCG